MKIPSVHFADWWIVFDETDADHWWNRFLKPGYRHCYAVRWDGYNWLKVEPTLAYFEVSVLPVVSFDEIGKVLRGTTAIEVRVVRGRGVRLPWLIGPWTCTEACKAILGIRDIRVVTPWQLHNHLRKRYGIERRRAENAGTAGAGAPPAR